MRAGLARARARDPVRRARLQAHAWCPARSLGADPFENAGDDDEQSADIHIRVQQRNGRKCITTVQGIDAALDLKKVLKVIKKVRGPRALNLVALARARRLRAVCLALTDCRAFPPCRVGACAQEYCCNGNIIDDEAMGQVRRNARADLVCRLDCRLASVERRASCSAAAAIVR